MLAGFNIATGGPGIVTAEESNKAFAETVVEAVGWHRHWDREHDSGA